MRLAVFAISPSFSTSMSALSNLLQLILGAAIGLAILGLGGAAAGYFVFSQLAVIPQRPVFPEERSDETATPEAPPEAQAQPAPTAAPEPQAAATPQETLEPGAYRMRVTWPDGLSIRAEPALDAEQIGGVAYDEITIVLESSDDGRWDRIRLPGSDLEGWVKAGNAERLPED